MIKTSLKNLFSNAVYLFIPMGIIYLFLLLAIFSFASGLFSGITVTFSQLSELIKTSAEQSSASLGEFFAYTVDQLGWDGDIFALLSKIFSPDWLRGVAEGFFGILNSNAENFGTQINDIIGSFVSSVTAYLHLAVWLCVAGIIAANCVTGYAVRRRAAKRGLKKAVIAHTVVPFLQALVIIGLSFLLKFVKLYGILLFAAVLIIMSGLSLFNAWLVHRGENLKLKQILTVKNVFSQIAAGTLVIIITLIPAAALAIANPLLGALIALPALIYALNVIEVNADSFVCAMCAPKASEE